MRNWYILIQYRPQHAKKRRGVRYVGVDTFVRAALIKVDAGRLQLPSDRTLHALVEHRYYGTQTLESQTPLVYEPMRQSLVACWRLITPPRSCLVFDGHAG
jgi:hypothetical protein